LADEDGKGHVERRLSRIRNTDTPPIVTLYGIRIPKNPKVKKMYLTDWQKREMMDEAGISCNFIELDDEVVPRFRYGLPTE